jgi:peptidoglycan DL-endopeptidase CwlO
MLKNLSRLLMAFVLSLLIVPSLCTPAFADSLAVKQAEADHVQAQVNALNNKTEIAAEKYNAARARYDTVTAKVKATDRQIAKLQKRQHTLQTHLNTRAVDDYRDGPFAFLSVLFSVRSFEEFQTTSRILSSLNEQDAATVAGLKDTKAQVQQARKTLVVAQAEARRQKDAMAANKQEVETQLEARKKLLAGLTSEIQVLLAQRITDQAASQQAHTMAMLLRQRTAASGGIILGGGQPSSPKAATAVYWAEKELGKPYVWAAAGPDTFDCSGLMLWSYDHVGVNLTHYSGDQIHQGASVSKPDLQAGDLVFFGSPIHHVGMYVGGGAFIEAPYTGTDVRITRLSDRGDFAGACRPAAN